MSDKLDIKIRHGRGKEQVFEIYTVPNRFNFLYPQYFQDIVKQQDDVAKYRANPETIDEDKLRKSLEETLEKKKELIKALMKANEHEYNEEFWEEMANPADINDMISACALKDISEDDKKKIAKMILR